MYPLGLSILGTKKEIVFMAFKGIIFILVIMLLTACAHKSEIHDMKSGRVVTLERLVADLPEQGNIVFGEYHYNTLIQNAESNLIRTIVTKKKLQGEFSVGWEFLTFEDQEKIEAIANKELPENKALSSLFPDEKTLKMHAPYVPLIRTIRNLEGQLIGLNAPREWKKDILARGLDKLDSKYKPLEIKPGSAGYFERFKLPMKDHVKENSTLEKFFEAQYYTDSIMAWAMEKHAKHSLRFFIAGSFHTDYKDGLVKAISDLSPLEVVTIKIVDATKMSENEIKELIEDHPEYGPIADFVYLVR